MQLGASKVAKEWIEAQALGPQPLHRSKTLKWENWKDEMLNRLTVDAVVRVSLHSSNRARVTVVIRNWDCHRSQPQ